MCFNHSVSHVVSQEADVIWHLAELFSFLSGMKVPRESVDPNNPRVGGMQDPMGYEMLKEVSGRMRIRVR